MLIENDEVERALLVLENVPAFFRDNPPSNLIKLREEIHSACLTTHAYLTSNCDADVTEEKALNVLNGLLRGRMVLEEVKRINEKEAQPVHIVDMGPGEYFVPIALKKMGLNFTYWPIALDARAAETAKPMIESHLQVKPHYHQTVLFLALEVIEHVPSVRDLVIEAFRHCRTNPHRIHISTPMYCYTDEHSDWNKPTGLPHLRAYTPTELMMTAHELFPQHRWELYPSQIMSVRGIRKDCADSGFLEVPREMLAQVSA